MENAEPQTVDLSHSPEALLEDRDAKGGTVTFAEGTVGDGRHGNQDTFEVFQVPKFDKFKVNIDMLMKFVFDPSLQWPLAAGRLFAFALYGPLSIDGHLCTGPKGSHVVATWELDIMCMQIEKEDMLQVGES